MIIVVSGVTGSGKTTIGQLLAKRINAVFADADDYHSANNKAKMKAGIALNDEDRQPWLNALNGVLKEWQQDGTGGVLACSALKQKYHATLEDGMPAGAVRFILLNTPKPLLVDRLAQRQHEFMNPALLESQLQTLEQPAKDTIVVVNDGTADQAVKQILQQLNGSAPERQS